MNKLVLLLAQLILITASVNALSIDSVIVDTVQPGEEGTIKIDVENEGNDEVQSISFRLRFPNDSSIIPLGSSEATLDSLDEDEDESFGFRFRVANNLAAGTYSISYTLEYEEDDDVETQEGTIGVIVSAEPEVEITANTQNAIIGQQGTLELRIVNKGLADARFVNVVIESEDITFINENSEYIGTIDSDDFETSSFDVIYNTKFPSITAIVTYKDFNNEEQEITETLSARAYTREEAIEKGILTKSNAGIYVGIVILLLVIWIIYRAIRRRRRNKN